METTMKLTKLLAATAFGLLLGAGGISAASAAPLHPRIAEVNHRLAHQEHRITNDLRHDRIGFVRAEHLRMRERLLHRQEVRMIVRDHGHLTRLDTRRLNHEENRVGRTL
jgi:hypothetical protein